MKLRHIFVLFTVAIAAAIAGCGSDDGPSQDARQEQAKATVCTARADISAQVTTLQRLTPNLASVPQVRTSVSAIVSDLGKISDAQPDLDPDTRQQVQAANKEFADQAKAVTKAALSGGLSGDVAGQLKPAIDELAQTYKDVFAPIEC